MISEFIEQRRTGRRLAGSGQRNQSNIMSLINESRNIIRLQSHQLHDRRNAYGSRVVMTVDSSGRHLLVCGSDYTRGSYFRHIIDVESMLGARCQINKSEMSFEFPDEYSIIFRAQWAPSVNHHYCITSTGRFEVIDSSKQMPVYQFKAVGGDDIWSDWHPSETHLIALRMGRVPVLVDTRERDLMLGQAGLKGAKE